MSTQFSIHYFIKNLVLVVLAQVQFEILSEVDTSLTPLMLAAQQGDHTKINALLNTELATINKQSTTGMTALHYGLEAQQENLALALLAAGARYDIPNNHKQYPLETAESLNLHLASTAIKKAMHAAISYPEYRDFAEKTSQNTAVLVIGYNRPQLFQKVIDALAANAESQKLPFFFVLDGGNNARQEEYIKIINSSKIKKKYIIKRPFNYGCDWNIVNALKFIFDWCKFKRVIHFEDDIVVTPNYLRFVLNFDEWAYSKFQNIGSVLGIGKRIIKREDKPKHLSDVFRYSGLWLGYCMRQSVWNDIRALVSEYEQILMISNLPKYWGKHPPLISTYHQWATKKINTEKKHRDFTKQNNMLKSHVTDAHFALEKFGGGQDTVLTFALYLKGYVTLSSVVNRYLCIGKEGVTFTEDMWKIFFSGIELDYFPSDTGLRKFKLIL